MSSLSERLSSGRLRELAALLLKAEQPSPSRKLVEPLLELLVGARFDLMHNVVIKEPRVILLILELLPHLSDQLQLELWSTLGAILHQSLGNTHTCRPLGLIEHCLEHLTKTRNSSVAKHIVDVAEILASYSMSVKELKAILSYLYTSQHAEEWAPYSVQLISTLNKMSVALQPDVFFSFSGTQGAVLTLPPLSKWPTQSGFSFSTWLRTEKTYDSQREYYKPVVYWFRTGRGLGYSAHFVGSNIVIETVSKNARKPQTHAVEWVFDSYNWYMLTVVYQYHMLRPSTLHCYINGSLVLSADVTLPVSEEVFDKCFLGGSPNAIPQSVFQGQMSAIYLWKEPLQATTIAALHKLGPGYKSQFKFAAEVDVPLTAMEEKSLFDGNLSGSLVFSYNAKAVDGQLVLEASPVEGVSLFAHSPHATMLEGVDPVVTTSFHSALHSLGGIQAIFPLFSQLDIPQSAGVKDAPAINKDLSEQLLSLVFEMAHRSTTYMLQLVQMKAFELISLLLERVSPCHLSEKLLLCMFNFIRYLSVAPNGEQLLQQLIEQFLFNAHLWKRATNEVQLLLYSQIAAEFSIHKLGNTSLDLREVVGMEQLMFILKEYYCLSSAHANDVRPYILLIAKQFVARGKGIQAGELDAFLSYLLSVPEEENLVDVLQLLLALVFEDSNHSIVRLLLNNHGIRVAARLLTCSTEALRINSIKLIGKILHHSSTRDQQSLLENEALLIVMKEKLLSAGQPLSVPMFNTLFELMLNRTSRHVIESHYLTLDHHDQITFSGMLPVIVELLITLQPSSTSCSQLMSLQLFTHILSLCSQNTANCRAIASLTGWQQWLLLVEQDPAASKAEKEALHSLLHKILHTVLMYGMCEEQDGWMLWSSTAAAIHIFRTEKTDLLTKCKLELPSHVTVDTSSSSLPSTPTLRSKDPDETSSTVSSSLDHDDSSVKLDDSPAIGRNNSSSDKDGPANLPARTGGENGGIVSGKVSRFAWSKEQKRFLKKILSSFVSILKNWKSHREGGGSDKVSRIHITDQLTDKKNLFLVSNAVQLTALVVDSMINQTGGIKMLLAECCHLPIAKKRQLPMLEDGDDITASSLLRLCLSITQTLVFTGPLKFSAVETRMNMEYGGVIRQCLRIILAIATIDCIKMNEKYKDFHDHYQQHKLSVQQLDQQSFSLLSTLGISSSHLQQYISSSLKQKLSALKTCQLLLNEENISQLHSAVPRDPDGKSLVQAQVSVIIYYLSVLCVAKYKHILDSVGQERGTLHHSPDNVVAAGQLPREEEEPAERVFTREESKEGSIGSSIGSASDLVRDGLERSTTFLGSEGVLQPATTMPLSHAMDVSEQVEVSLKLAGGCLCQLLVENRSVLNKVLVASDGRHLLSDAVMKLAENGNIVEITMLLCSQEWQGSLQKLAGKYFSGLLLEGKHVYQFSESYLRSIAHKMVEETKKLAEEEMNKFTIFEEQLSLYMSSTIKSNKQSGQLRKSDIRRHQLSAEKLWRKVSPIVDAGGTFDFTPLKPSLLWRLELREDGYRCRQKVLPNLLGSHHLDAVRVTNEAEQASRSVPEAAGIAIAVTSAGSEDDPNQSLSEDPMTGETQLSILEVSLTGEEAPQVTIQCSMVTLSLLLPGALYFTKHSLTFTADDSSEAFSKAISLGESCSVSESYSLDSVVAVFSRRYLHRSIALEIFFTNKSSMFLTFETAREVKQVVSLLPKVGVGAHYNLPQTRATSLASPAQLFRRSNMTERWQKREVSNFDYLMYLNTIAGRSMNDISQYPVFPWVLADYTSDSINLKDPSVYRDLSKPIGALNPSKLEQYVERYECWESDQIPAFHYGTHYSTLAFVFHWLVRVEPFTSLHIDLHDGFFDHGSRIFSSLPRAWENCQRDPSDVKELIPELFYLPEMLLNSNKFFMGRDENSEDEEKAVVGDVVLPPWATSAHHFIQTHRDALESDYVSANLHSWIDIIFGYKQKGPDAVEATNVFYYLTYPGSVNWSAITDTVQLQAVKQQILQFGQTPVQLLREAHPARHPIPKEFPPQPIYGSNPAVVAELHITPDVPIGLVHLSQSSSPSSSSVSTTSPLLVLSYNQLCSINKWGYSPGTSSQPPSVSLDPDPILTQGLKVCLGDPLDQSMSASSLCFVVSHAGDVVLICGFWDNSFKSFTTENGQLLQSVFGHKSIVTCITLDTHSGLCSLPGDGLVASGSRDATVLLWAWSGRTNRIISPLSTSKNSVTPLAILNGHEHEVTCVAVSSSMGLVASGAKSGLCLLHGTSGELLHKLVPNTAWTHPHMISSTPRGHFLVHYADQKGCLAVFTCNGKQLAYRSLNEPALAMSMSSDGQHVVIGGFSGTAYVLDTHTLSLVYQYEPCTGSIRSLHMSYDHRFVFAGLASGAVSVLTTHFWRL